MTKAAPLFGLSRTEGIHYVRVLKLPPDALDLLTRGALSFGQARVIARIANRPEQARLLAIKVASLPGTPARARRRSFTVRAVERLVAETLREMNQSETDVAWQSSDIADRRTGSGVPDKHSSGDLRRAERLLAENCGFPVQIQFDPQSQRGRLIVRFSSIDEFQTISELLAPGIDFDAE
jgi:ParB-like chromosome segregation protein Spo0J